MEQEFNDWVAGKVIYCHNDSFMRWIIANRPTFLAKYITAWSPERFGEIIQGYANNPEILAVLLAAGADPNSASRSYTLLREAIACNNEESVKILLQAGACTNLLSIEIMLGHAIRRGRSGMVKILVDAGINVNARVEYGYTVLMLACQMCNPEIVEMLLQAGSDPNLHNNGRTALDDLCYHGYDYPEDCVEKIVKLLVAAGFNVNTGEVPTLIRVAKLKNPTVINFLLDNTPVDINARSPVGVTPLMCLVGYPVYLQVAHRLIAAGADVNAVDDSGCSVLMWAIDGCEDIIGDLIKAGADPNFIHPGRIPGRKTALMHAAEIDCYNAAKTLIANGADIDLQTTKGYTALMYAARKGSGSCTYWLLVKAGADQGLKNSQGETAADFLRDSPFNTMMAELLEEKRQLEEENARLRVMVHYMPGNDGYKECKSHFELLQDR